MAEEIGFRVHILPAWIFRGSHDTSRTRYSYPAGEFFPRPVSNAGQTPGVSGKEELIIPAFSGIQICTREETLDFPLSSMIQIVYPLLRDAKERAVKTIISGRNGSNWYFPTFAQTVSRRVMVGREADDLSPVYKDWKR